MNVIEMQAAVRIATIAACDGLKMAKVTEQRTKLVMGVAAKYANDTVYNSEVFDLVLDSLTSERLLQDTAVIDGVMYPSNMDEDLLQTVLSQLDQYLGAAEPEEASTVALLALATGQAMLDEIEVAA